jgi:uncharacterized protein (TIGR03437 family)
MALIIQIGKAATCGRGPLLALISIVFASISFGQTCTASSSPVFVHQEGLAELVASITVTCTGGSGGTISPAVYVSLNGNVTNRLDVNGNPTGITVSGAGVTSSGTPSLSSAKTVSFSLSMPGSSPIFTISGLRVAVPSIGGGTASPSVTATVLATLLSFSTSQPFAVAVSGPTLAESIFNFGLPCAGSPTPATIDIPTLISTGTLSSTVRVTEASVAAFQPVTSGADFGVRVMLNLSGYPSGATVYVPDVIVGNRAPTPTTSGDFGPAAAGGTYSPAGDPLLLVRVVGADATGAGGTILFATPPGGSTAYTTAFQPTLVGGAASVTYEVVDANAGFTDSGQIPVWVALPAFSCAATPPANTLAATVVPVSTATVGTQTDPIPRYLATVPGSDCSIIGDCTANYFPQLEVSTGSGGTPSLSLTGYSQGPKQTGFITLTDGGSNQYSFTASVTYTQNTALSSASWLSLNATSGIVGPTAGVGSFTLAAVADPTALLIQGTYQATITINAGAAGTATIPVSFVVGPTQATIQAVVNAANGQPGPVTANSFATIYGVNLVPKTTTFATVVVDGYPATVSYDGQPSASAPSQINFLVPSQLAGGSTAGLFATVDGVNTNTVVIQLVPNAPAVFNPGILNQNNTVNLATAPASRGDIIQIFLTGLTTPVNVPVSVTIGTQSQSGNQLFYAGPVVSIPGLEQINVQVPPSLSFTGNSVNLSVCIPGSGSQQTCSPAVPLYLH